MTDQQTPQVDERDSVDGRRTFSEELEVAGSQLVERVKELIQEGNVRRLILRNPDNRIMLEIPLTVGVVGAAALGMFWPVLAALAVIAGLVTRVKIEIVREISDDNESPDDKMKRG